MEEAEDPADKDSFDASMERKEAGGKRKTEINDVLQTKQVKNKVHVVQPLLIPTYVVTYIQK
eukprot:14299806-Ditylum_brightwellii.AAC.1